ncbi:buffy [Carabus blaptoides fortunei]
MASDVTHTDKPVLEPSVFPKLSFGLPPSQRRKFSFPAALHANLLGLSSTVSADSAVTASVSTRRRFSNVGDVVSRKLSNTIGWRTLPVPPQEVVAQGKALCCQYIRNRLKRSGIFNKKLGLYRLRSVMGTPNGMIVTEVYPSLVTAGQELERMHPKVYTSVARQASSTPAGVIISDKAAASLLLAVGREVVKSDVTWGKVVAVFAIAGGLAVDCVCQGHPEYLHGLVEGLTDLLEEDLAEWIATNGGWTSLSAQCRPPHPEISPTAYLSIFGLFLLVIFAIFIILRFFGKLYLL